MDLACRPGFVQMSFSIYVVRRSMYMRLNKVLSPLNSLKFKMGWNASRGLRLRIQLNPKWEAGCVRKKILCREIETISMNGNPSP